MPIRHAGDDHSLWDTISILLKFSFVHVFLIALFFIGTVPLSMPISANFFLIGLYFWTMYRPTVLPFSLVLFYGILADSLYVNAIGFYTLIFLAIIGFIRWQRLRMANQIFIIHWGMFIVLLCIIAILKYIVAALFFSSSLNLMETGQEILVAGLVFPFINMLLFYQNRLLSS